jgi:hypothetical protein
MCVHMCMCVCVSLGVCVCVCVCVRLGKDALDLSQENEINLILQTVTNLIWYILFLQFTMPIFKSWCTYLLHDFLDCTGVCTQDHVLGSQALYILIHISSL